MSEDVGGAGARPRVGGATHVVGVIGWPVTHSLSPTIHNAAFGALAMDWIYVPLPVPPGRVAEALAGLRALGLVGANVTMPHKTEVAELVDETSEDAARLRSVNTLVVAADGISGHNTDAPGFDRFLRRDAGFDPDGRTALVFGAGGAARACALALARGGLAGLTVALREPSRAEALRSTLEGFDLDLSAIPFEDAATATSDLIVNATPLGAHGETLPLPALGPGVLAVDLLYRSHQTPLMAAVRAAGGVAFGGIGLLLEQAALAFELWTGQPAPTDVMSAAALAELTEMASSSEAVGPEETSQATAPRQEETGGGPSAER